jgi:signal transduction histidine kinase
LWGAITGPMVGWALIAIAPFVRGRVKHRRFVLGNSLVACCVALIVIWAMTRWLGFALPSIDRSRSQSVPASLTGALAVAALLCLLSLIGYSNRFRKKGEDLDYWLALVATLMLFSSLHFIFTPLMHVGDVSQGDFLRLLAYGVLLVGVWRAIRGSEFGRAVAEERARVAREIHDGLAQYLFAVSTHASMMEAGADPKEMLPRIKEAALLAQQEARYAILALSSASGRAPFDSALRRYVDLLTADGKLEVELTIDRSISLGPDEQIELFKIVQEGLANSRKHAGARRAWVEIGERGGERFVSVRDDGSGFEPDIDTGQGLKNMRERAGAIGGAFSMRSSPGGGTALEIVLRA